MSRAKSNKVYRTFVKGLVTEASPLTYPEDTSYNELNTILSRKGSRTRRLGQTYLENTIDADLLVTNPLVSQNEYVWKAVGKNANLNFLVVQRGRLVKFYDLAYSALVDKEKSFSIDLADYLRPSASVSDMESNIFQMAGGKGYLFIVGRDIEPLYITYDLVTDTITVEKITILIRDYDGLRDGLANDEEPTTLSKEHHYNLMNQGWVLGSTSTSAFTTETLNGYTLTSLNAFARLFPSSSAYSYAYSTASSANSPIFKFHSELSRYPGNNKQWWVAKAAADDPDKGIVEGQFLPKVLDKQYSGNNRAPRGHFILDAFRKDRSALSGISDIAIESTDYRPEAISFFSGRAWYAAGSIVYFSQILDTTGGTKAGLCYQEADPTAEDISDLIASDGGVVPIPEADRIIQLVPLANGVLVFAQNGVWFISGGDAAFSATGISVDKVSSIGTKSPLANTEVDGTLFWWSDIGIQALDQKQGQFGPIPGKFGNTNISEQTIQTLYNQIPENAKKYAKVCYDNRNNRLMWLYSDDYINNHEYDNCLLFDLTLQAFFLWKFSDITNGPRVSGFYNNVGETVDTSENMVIASGVQVTSTSNGDVYVPANIVIYGPSSIEYLINIPSQGLAVSATEDTNYLDWNTFDDIGATYESFIETGYELMNDTMRNKQTTYVVAHFRRADNSSCTMTTKWDWSTGVNSNRWSTPIEAYRERNRPTPTTADLEAYEVVTSKNKVRGSGKAVQFKFGTSEMGKNFDLLGWSVAYTGNTSV